MELDLASWSNAVQRLHEALARYQSDISDTQIRDGLIQRFEFTGELSHKMLKRYPESAAINPTEFDGADFLYLIRSGNEQGLLLSAWPQWRHYRNMRSKISNTYDEATALLAADSIPVFLGEARYLLRQLQTGPVK